MLLIHAKDNGLGEAVGLFQEIRQVPRDSLGAGAQCHPALKIGGRINFVGNFPAVAVQVILAGAPTGGVPLRDDAVYPVRGQEAVVNALPQAVGVLRVAKIQVGVAVLVAQGRGGHAKLIRG